MNRKIAAALVAASVVAGVGAGFAARQWDGTPVSAAERVATTATPSATTTATATTPGLDEARQDRRGPSWSPADPIGPGSEPLTIGDVVPGGIEPVMAGTPVEDAMATGLVERDDSGTVCEGTRYVWTGDLADGFDLQVREDGVIGSIGMRKDGAETANGISIGNSYGFLRRVYGAALSEPEESGYTQTGLFVRDGSRWIGFLFDEHPDRISDGSRISMIEVTDGSQPSLMRDGC